VLDGARRAAFAIEVPLLWLVSGSVPWLLVMNVAGAFSWSELDFFGERIERGLGFFPVAPELERGRRRHRRRDRLER
jgi:hypothetical protein